MEKEIELAIRKAYNKYMVRHVPIKDDTRCRTEIMFEEAASEIMKIYAGMVKLDKDTTDLKSVAFNCIPIRVRVPVQNENNDFEVTYEIINGTDGK